jgi:hypothetical protein
MLPSDLRRALLGSCCGQKDTNSTGHPSDLGRRVNNGFAVTKIAPRHLGWQVLLWSDEGGGRKGVRFSSEDRILNSLPPSHYIDFLQEQYSKESGLEKFVSRPRKARPTLRTQTRKAPPTPDARRSTFHWRLCKPILYIPVSSCEATAFTCLRKPSCISRSAKLPLRAFVTQISTPTGFARALAPPSPSHPLAAA